MVMMMKLSIPIEYNKWHFITAGFAVGVVSTIFILVITLILLDADIDISSDDETDF